mgnify:CR=1 FL=1
MSKYLEAVNEFHQAFGHPTNPKNADIPLELRQLRIKLLFEELEELAEATGCKGTMYDLCQFYGEGVAQFDEDKRDKVEEIDALADLQYVLSGAILAMGHHETFDEAFDEVQRSNMSKMCNTLQEAKDTQDWYSERDGTSSIVVDKGDKWVVLRENDKKILKNKYYSPADLSKFV